MFYPFVHLNKNLISTNYCQYLDAITRHSLNSLSLKSKDNSKIYKKIIFGKTKEDFALKIKLNSPDPILEESFPIITF